MHALAIGCLQDVFQYGNSDAAEVVEAFIQASSDSSFRPQQMNWMECSTIRTCFLLWQGAEEVRQIVFVTP